MGGGIAPNGAGGSLALPSTALQNVATHDSCFAPLVWLRVIRPAVRTSTARLNLLTTAKAVDGRTGFHGISFRECDKSDELLRITCDLPSPEYVLFQRRIISWLQ